MENTPHPSVSAEEIEATYAQLAELDSRMSFVREVDHDLKSSPPIFVNGYILQNCKALLPVMCETFESADSVVDRFDSLEESQVSYTINVMRQTMRSLAEKIEIIRSWERGFGSGPDKGDDSPSGSSPSVNPHILAA